MCKTILNWIFTGRGMSTINIFSAEFESDSILRKKLTISSKEIEGTKRSKRIKLCFILLIFETLFFFWGKKEKVVETLRRLLSWNILECFSKRFLKILFSI